MTRMSAADQATVSLIQNVLLTNCKALVRSPDDVVVVVDAAYPGFASFSVWCSEDDAGALIGRHGKMAGTMRYLVMSIASARGFRMGVQFLSRDQHELPAR